MKGKNLNASTLRHSTGWFFAASPTSDAGFPRELDSDVLAEI